jgi:D-aspartate ligase
VLTSHRIPAFVTYMSSSAVAIARSLGRRGIPVYSVDSRPNALGEQSRYLHPLRSPDVREDEEGYIQFLLDVGRRFGERPVLLPTGDITVLPISRHRARLRERFRFALTDDDILRRAVSKRGLDELARTFGVPAPRTRFPVTGEDIAALAEEITYPALLKPAFSPRWQAPAIAALIGQNTKVVRVESKDELVAQYARLSPLDPDVIVQEVVPGDDDQLFYVCFYCDREGEPVGMFAGQKLRLYPIHFGSASFVRSCHEPRLLETTAELLRGMRYHGLGGVEFKRDPRDGTFKLIEFNARFGLWDSLGARLGIDLAYMAYRDAVGQSIEKRWEYPAGVGWVDFERDLAAYRAYRDEGSLSLPAWLRSLSPPMMASLFAVDDPAPFLAFGAKVLSRRLKRYLAPRVTVRAGLGPAGPVGLKAV